MIFKVQEIRFTDVDYFRDIPRVNANVTLTNAVANMCQGNTATLIIEITDKQELKKYTDAYFNKTDIIVDIKI